MIAGFLFDENLPKWWRRAVRRRSPHLPIYQIGVTGGLPKRTQDPDVLIWCESHQYALVTDNRRRMPLHLKSHLAAGRHVEGIFRVDPKLAVAELAEGLTLIFEISLPEEFRDQYVYWSDIFGRKK